MFGTVSLYRSFVLMVAFCVGLCFSDCLRPIAFSRQGGLSVAYGACVDADEVRAWYAEAMRTLTAIAVTYTGVEELPSDFCVRLDPHTGALLPDPEAIKRGYPGGGDWFSRSEGVRTSRRSTRYWDGHRYVAIVRSKEPPKRHMAQMVDSLDPSFANTVGPNILLGWRLSQCLISFEETRAEPDNVIIQKIIEDGQSNWREVINPVASRHGFDARFVAEMDVSKGLLPRRGFLQQLVASGAAPDYINLSYDNGSDDFGQLIDQAISVFRRIPIRSKLLEGTGVNEVVAALDVAFLSRGSQRPTFRPEMFLAAPLENHARGEESHTRRDGKRSGSGTNIVPESQKVLQIRTGEFEETTRTVLQYGCVAILILNTFLIPRLIARFGAMRFRKSRRRSSRRSNDLFKRWTI